MLGLESVADQFSIEETTMLQGVGFAADATGYGRERIFWRMVEVE